MSRIYKILIFKISLVLVLSILFSTLTEAAANTGDTRKASSEKSVQQWDCIIVGGGPAGLAAATYLARFRRKVLVLDDNNSRLSSIPIVHNYLGFPVGISGKKLLRRMQKQAINYGAILRQESVKQLQRNYEKEFIVKSNKEEYYAKKILLAIGLQEVTPPDFLHMDNAIKHGLVRDCPVCDASEIINQKIGVIGYGNPLYKKAKLLLTYTKDVTLLSSKKTLGLSTEEEAALEEVGARFCEEPVTDIKIKDNEITTIHVNKRLLHFDRLYSAFGSKIDLNLLSLLKVNKDQDNHIIVDERLQTSVPGLYAAGDVVSPLKQICIASGQGAIAATDIHNTLD